MSKIVRTTDSDYRIQVAEGGQITLHTGFGLGGVVITGDLTVQGTRTVIDSTVTTIEDNIIILSEGNEGVLPATLDRPNSSGIEIDRGTIGNARWVYDDGVTWDIGGTIGRGTWIAEQGNIGTSSLTPITVNKIITQGDDLYVSCGNNVISVAGSNNYEEKVWRYENGIITPDPITNSVVLDDDIIPNAKALRDFISYQNTNIAISNIQIDDTQVVIDDRNHTILRVNGVGSTTSLGFSTSHGYGIGEPITISGVLTTAPDPAISALNGTHTVVDTPDELTIVIDLDTRTGDENNYKINSGQTVGPETNILFKVSGDDILTVFNNRVELASVQIIGNEISNINSNEDLVLNSSGVGTVKIKDILEITKTPGDDDANIDPIGPLVPEDGIKVYSKNQGPGGTGLYFVNDDEVQGEFISKNRALIYSMLF